MGVFRQFPYSNFHEMNMDEIIKIVKTLSEEWDTTKTEWASYKDFIDNYFENLDVSEEVLSALRTMSANGELNTIIDPVIASETAEWLSEHITVTEGTTVIDNTLSIEGAAADAKATGDAINAVKSDLSVVAVQKDLSYLTPANVRHPGCVQYTYSTNTYAYYTSAVFNSWYSNIFDVEPNKKYKVLGSMYPATPIAVFMDENNNYIGHDGYDKDYSDYVFLDREIIVTTPANCTQLIVQRGNNNIPSAREVIIVNSLDDEVEELHNIADKIEPLIMPADSAPITLTLEANYYLDSNGAKSSFNNANYKITEPIDVIGGDNIIITGTVGTVGNSFYTFLDANNLIVNHEVSTVTGTKTFDVIVPQNATKLILSAFNGVAYAGLVENYKIKGSSSYWENKKWVCIGDSLTEVNNTTSKHYFDYIADDTGIETVNFGIGGTGYVNPNGTAGNFTTRMASVPTDADVYTIFGSFNDYEYCINNNIPIGSPTDSGTNTICGYINGAFSALFARVPLANLGVIAPNPWGSVNDVSGSATAKEWAENYTEALRLCCERLSIPFLDLYHYSGMRPWDSAFEALTYTHDSLYGVHPDETGHAILAPKFRTFLESLLM